MQQRSIKYTVDIDVLCHNDVDIEKLRAIICEDIDRACEKNCVELSMKRILIDWRIESTGD